MVPRLVKTELWSKTRLSTKAQEERFAKATGPLGFIATPDDIAEAYLYLAKADYATGTSVELGEF